jgi:hypothetical protein
MSRRRNPLVFSPELQAAIDDMLERLDCEEFRDEFDRLIYWRIRHPPNPRGYVDVKLEDLEAMETVDRLKDFVDTALSVQGFHNMGKTIWPEPVPPNNRTAKE